MMRSRFATLVFLAATAEEPLPRQLSGAHRRHEPVAPGWVPLDSDWLTGGDAWHHGVAGPGAAPAGTDSC